MSNPPGWVYRTKQVDGHREVDVMAGLAAGVVTAGDVNSQPTITTPMAPATWSYIWFGLAVLYLIGVYTGSIRIARER